MRFSALLLSVLTSCLCVYGQTFSLSGTVRDASSGEPLAAANIRLDGSARGTISNADGLYRLSLPPGPYAIIFSFIGYRPDTVRVNLSSDVSADVLLKPIAIQLSEIVVTDEDPAYRIMRKVIENKSRWKENLKTYQFDAFTRQVLRRDTAIASITESYTTGYWQEGDTLREVVRQKRQTENIPMAQNFAAVGGIVNFYDDEIRFSGFTFVGPTSPEAFEYYGFRLEHTREQDGAELYTIRMTPLTKVTPLFAGTINIIGESYAVVGIEVKPNEAYRIPFVSRLDITYAQQFTLLEKAFWMPVDIRLKGSAQIGIAGFSFPRIGFDMVSSIYDYRLNAEIPDSIALKPRRTVAPEAEVFDSTFWTEKEVLALTEEEKTAYNTLDSTQTLQKQFQPTGPLSSLNTLSGGFLKHVDFRFNRAEGFFLGGEVQEDSVASWLKGSLKTGYGFSDKKMKLSASAEVFLDEKRMFSVGGGAYSDITHFPDEGFFGAFTIALSSLFSKIDQRDYFYIRGFELFGSVRPVSTLQIRMSYKAEQQTSAFQRTDYSFFAGSKRYRIHPPIQEGLLRSLTLSGRYGDSPVPLNLVSVRYIEVEAEYSDKPLLKSDFGFKRITVEGEYFVPTFLKRNLFPPTLTAKFAGGISGGDLPPQRIFTMEGRSIGYGPFGLLKGAGLKEFTGDRYAMLALEHNFRSIPFLALDIPFLYENSIELIIHGAIARSWNDRGNVLPFGRPTDGWYSEAGIGLSRLFGLFRIDLTRRFTSPEAFYLTLGIARVF